MKNIDSEISYGLVLEGGGAKGAYQIGVWQALRELKIQIDAVTGTSIGAINGAFVVLDLFDEVYNLWFNIEPDLGIKGDREILSKLIDFKFDINSEDFKKIMKYIKDTVKYGGLDITPLKEILNTYIDEEKLRNSKIDYGVVTVSLTDMKAVEIFKEDIPKGKLHNYIIASANLPIFKLEKLENKLYIDGGFYDNLPISLMIKKGYKNIIAVRQQGIGVTRSVKEKNLNIIYIEPSGNTGKTLEFKKETARRNLKMGYYDTLRTFKACSGKRYCINVNKPKDYFFNLFANAPEWSIDEVRKIFGENQKPSRRLVFEKIIPSITDLLDIDDNASYQDIVIELLEFIADMHGVDRFKIYEFDDFLDILYKLYLESENYEDEKVSYSIISDFLKQTPFFRRTIKDKLLISVFGVICKYLKDIRIK